MALNQLRQFEKHLKTGKEHRGKVLQASIDEALKFKISQNKENYQVTPETTATSHKVQTAEASTMESSTTAKKTFFKVVNENDGSEINKLKEANLKKRKPVVDKQRLHLIKKDSKTSSIETSESLSRVGMINDNQKASTSRTKIFDLKFSSTEASVMAMIDSDMSAVDVPRVANALAEQIACFRDTPSSMKNEEKIALFNKILKFCEVCSVKSDDELKQMVIKRVGSYLTAIYYLLLDVEDRRSELHSKTVHTVCQLISVIKIKTLNYVN